MIRFDDPGDTSQMLADSAARFLAENYTLTQRAQMLTTPPADVPAHWATIADLGWLAAPLPEDAGGLGLSPADLAPLLARLARGLMLEPVNAAILHCATCLAHALPADRAAAALAPMLAGETVEVLIDGGQATPVGDGWRITAEHRGCAGAAAASVIWVAATGPDGRLLFRLPAQGAQIRPLRLIDGQPAGHVSIDTTARPETARDLPRALSRAAEMSLFGVLAESDGLIEALYEDTLTYVKMREQFGRPIGRFQSIQHRMAEMFILREECLSMVRLAAGALQSDDDGFRSRILSSARIKLMDAAQEVWRSAVQLHGGMGVTDELEIGHRVKRLLVLARQAGTRHGHLDALKG